jgi:hypothetical protein
LSNWFILNTNFLKKSGLSREKQWQHEWGYISRFGSHSSASRGVAVLFKNSFEFHINQEIIDECGNFIILDINTQDPNDYSRHVLRKGNS